MKKVLPILLIVILAGFGLYYFSSKSAKPTTVDMPRFGGGETEENKIAVKKASFAIFTNGTFRTFSAERYHNLTEEVFINPESPNTVVVTEEGITWGDFFDSLPMEVTKDCLTTGTGQVFCTGEKGTLKSYLNGQRDDSLLEKEIKNGDKILISFGNEGEEEIQNQLNQVPEAN